MMLMVVLVEQFPAKSKDGAVVNLADYEGTLVFSGEIKIRKKVRKREYIGL